MLAQCPKCGFENIAQNRFCGMCGAQLIAPVSTPVSSPAIPTSGIPSSPVRQAPAQESPSQRLRTEVPPQRTSSILGLGNDPPARTTPPLRESPSERIQSQAVRTSQPRERSVPVSGPSFLGLSDEPARDLDYLLEDEEPTSGRKSMSIVFLLLLAGVVYAGWRWRAEIYPSAVAALHRVEAIVAPSSSTSSSSQTQTEPPPASTTDSHTITPQDEHSTTVPEKTETTKQPPVGASANPSSAAPNEAVPASVATSTQTEKADSAGSESPDVNSEESSAKADETPATDTVPAKNAKPRAAVPKSLKREIQPATSSDISDERLIADGEKYLYGTGVSENCSRAQKSLQTAAQHSNPKAQAMLGTMYFTGHCATRDLPTAYRWFARALHGDPGNSRIQQDLEILWKAMTPDERQIAMRRE
jgi:Sel1 repeat-containing protein